MSEWINSEADFDDPVSGVEELLRLAADEMPAVRSGLKTEIITSAQKTQRDLRRQQVLWGGLVFAMLFLGGLTWWPASPSAALAANEETAKVPEAAASGTASDAIDWQLVESKNQLRRRNLEILKAAF